MSDPMRKSTGEQVKEKMQPDSTKGLGQQISEGLTGKADDMAGKAQPQESKGVFQSMKDTVMGNEGAGSKMQNEADKARTP
ncbi:heat shock protein 9/12-domain-containing protein [Hyaloraphidium curvatum]|nr:heat shock protein 9/12-domain-containing protein [Hyaloraphidium curvatum]